MLYFSRWKTAATLGTALIVSFCAFVNVLPAHTFEKLPVWAQRKITLGTDLQGGGRYQFAVDTDYLLQELKSRLLEDVRHLLRQSQLGHAGLAIRDGAVEVRARQPSDLPKIVSSLQVFVEPVAHSNLPRSGYFAERPNEKSLTASWDAYLPPARVDVTFDDQVVRLTLTNAAINDRIKQGRMKSIDVVSRRLRDVGAKFEVRPVSSDRLVLEVFDPQERWRLVQY